MKNVKKGAILSLFSITASLFAMEKTAGVLPAGVPIPVPSTRIAQPATASTKNANGTALPLPPQRSERRIPTAPTTATEFHQVLPQGVPIPMPSMEQEPTQPPRLIPARAKIKRAAPYRPEKPLLKGVLIKETVKAALQRKKQETTAVTSLKKLAFEKAEAVVASPDITDRNGNSALIYIAENAPFNRDTTAAIEALLALGADINFRNQITRTTPLLAALTPISSRNFRADPGLAEWLIAQGADVESMQGVNSVQSLAQDLPESTVKRTILSLIEKKISEKQQRK